MTVLKPKKVWYCEEHGLILQRPRYASSDHSGPRYHLIGGRQKCQQLVEMVLVHPRYNTVSVAKVSEERAQDIGLRAGEYYVYADASSPYSLAWRPHSGATWRPSTSLSIKDEFISEEQQDER